MRAFVKRTWTVAIHLPTHVIPVHAPLACFDVGSTCTNIELHTNRLVLVLAKLNGAPIRNLDAPFCLALCRQPCLCLFALEGLHGFVGMAETSGWMKKPVNCRATAMAACETGHLGDAITPSKQHQRS